jgi:uncharacterized protein YigE (DUF2233 family)
MSVLGFGVVPPCTTRDIAGVRVAVCEWTISRDSLELYWRDANGRPIGSFARLDSIVHAHGRHLAFATNGGIFAPGQIPLGLFVQHGQVLVPINLRDSTADPPPNFYLKPNGVFYVATGRAAIVESSAYPALGVAPDLAVQSGPLLVSGSRIHPALNPAGPSKYVRNGVGVRADGTVVFAMTRDPVNLYTFATIFRDALRCRDALYLDGAISQFLVAGDRPDTTGQFAGIIAVTTR